MHTWGPLTSRFQVPPQLAESQLLQWGLCLVWVLTLPGHSYSDRLGDRTTELHTFYPKHRRRTEQKHKGVSSPVTKAENYWKTLHWRTGPIWPHFTLVQCTAETQVLGDTCLWHLISTLRKVRALILNSVWFEWKLNSPLFAHWWDQSSPSCHFLKNKSYCYKCKLQRRCLLENFINTQAT